MLSSVVLDMACHVPLYRALLELLRAIAVCPSLMPLLLPLDGDDDSSVSISSLLEKMKQCVDTYASRLKYVTYQLIVDSVFLVFFHTTFFHSSDDSRLHTSLSVSMSNVNLSSAA